ncbi:MAG: hypothetical protein R8P61_16030 [Bacteroidia bacterium]|nr:hypothetical protein [Bacteroidia bacterium]
MKKIAFPLIFLLATLMACQEDRSKPQVDQQDIPAQFASLEDDAESFSENFNEYWYKGEAEISSYKLEQARYGEIHEGHAVLVYVTEDFSKKKQVKLDNAGSAGTDRVPILKLNLTKKFNTGIYPYSIMQSIFTPVELDKHPHSLKTTMSSQEWCGHVFAQLNNRKNHFELSSYSYFESEGDVNKEIEKVMLEDELWTRIRINPAELPTGKVKLIPSVIHSRLRHRELKAEEAIINLEEKEGKMHYKISYASAGRSLEIVFGKAFPHKILSWEESSKSGFGPNARNLVTKASLMESLNTDYWSKHNTDDLHLRDKLRLP